MPLVGLPEGLTAHAVRVFRSDNEGNPVTIRDRRGRQKLEEVELISDDPLDDNGMDEADRRFLLSTHRRSWETVASRYGDQTWAKAVQFARQGAIAIRCAVDQDLTLGQPIAWRLTDQWADLRTRQEGEDDARKSQWRLRAESTASLVEALSPELAQALRATQPSQKLQVLVFAAEDLLNGMVHTGPRAFSQAHFGETKKGPDVLALLREANLEVLLLTRLGIDRTAYIGVAGPIQAVTSSGTIEVQMIRGPVLVRGDRSLQLKLTKRVPLLLVENLQAAESVADTFPNLAIVYTAGLMPETSLELVRGLGSSAGSVFIIPDADLGGVRLVEQILGVVREATVVDIGSFPHPERRAWSPEGATIKALRQAVMGAAGSLAQACLDRGYPVEQELAIISAVRAVLGTEMED